LRDQKIVPYLTQQFFSSDGHFKIRIGRNKNYLKCLIDGGTYLFRISDGFGDGIQCEQSFDGFGCYQVYINQELIFQGPSFDGFVREHTMDTSSSLCWFKHEVIVETAFPIHHINNHDNNQDNNQDDEEDYSLLLQNVKTSEFLDFASFAR